MFTDEEKEKLKTIASNEASSEQPKETVTK